MGGTEKCMQYFVEYLHNAGHDCYCIHNRQKTDEEGCYREKLLLDILDNEKVLAYSSEEEFFSILAGIQPDIFHVHRSGRPDEFPIVPRLKDYVGKCVETNIFGGYDSTKIIDLTIYVSDYLNKNARHPNRKTCVIYNPVKEPLHTKNLRSTLGISPATFVMGRIGRPDDYIFDAISLRALKIIEGKGDYDILYLVQSPPPNMIRVAQDIGLKKVKFLTAPIVTDEEITSFFNTIDILAHARKDGETFGLNIAEAMIHGKPVISHRSHRANAHKPFVKKCGFFVRRDNFRQYAKCIGILYHNKKKRLTLGRRGHDFARENFLLTNIGKKLEECYKQLHT
jgi:glycosyltransferase involved in cell wall biosynthesis